MYIVTHLSVTSDDSGTYVTADSSEIIELAWVILDRDLAEVHRGNLLVRPLRTPITPLCTTQTGLSWDLVEKAGSLQDVLISFDAVIDRLQHRGLGVEPVFVTGNAHCLLVHLDREARDKGLMLPKHLRHPKVYDLRHEYVKWADNHPEMGTATHNNTSLAGMCATLNLAEHVPGFQHMLAKPRRALDEAVLESIIVAVLLRIVSSSSSPVDRHTVFTHPIDRKADFDAFVAQQSVILHLSNLAPDTTQNELESWFAQHGGPRPIALWTLRVPLDQVTSAESGYALFASHREAMEGLLLNGRALNDREVAVSPSGAQVLEHARPILAPFPPTKNRPRPGDWRCPSCGFSNFQRRIACFKCSYVPPPADGFTRVEVPFRAGDWKCGNEDCEYHNFAKNVFCLRCGGGKPVSTS